MVFGFFKSQFQKFKQALTKTSSRFAIRLKAILNRPLDEDTLNQLEELLYEGDLGTQCVQRLIDAVKDYAKKQGVPSKEILSGILEKEALNILSLAKTPQKTESRAPLIYLIVGVNGSGKTTTIAKLAHHAKKEGKKVLVAACDTFRAAASCQLSIWAERVGFDLVESASMADPASVAFDAAVKATTKGYDILFIDTAGRLESKEHLLHELAKIYRTVEKAAQKKPDEVLFVLDATTGQTALAQMERFSIHAPITGLIITKLDGSAKGGVLLPIVLKTALPIYWVGLGEKSEDLIPFDPESYAKALFES